MKVYALRSDMKSISLKLHNRERDRGKLDAALQGKYVVNWEPIDLVTTVKKRNDDCPNFFPGVSVFSLKAVELLKPYVSNFVQFLSINHEKSYWLVNVVNVIDCVDYNRSIARKNRHGNIAGFEKISFLKDKIESEYIYKIQEHINTEIYVTDQFRDIVLGSKLKGFDFIEVWDSEDTVEVEQERQLNYEKKLAEIEQYIGTKCSWAEAVKLVESGKAAVSGKWKIQNTKAGIMFLGQLSDDLTYFWINPTFLPPILLDLKWHEDEKSDI